MAKEDEEKTAFITIQGILCYTKMPFSLRNAGATYQRLVDKAFHKQIGRNLEAYVDDLVIKSHTKDEIVRDIEETFKTLREINMKVNPKKCTFGVEEEMFLGYKVNTKGLKVCPDKVDDVLSLSSPKCLKDKQKLNEKLTSEAEEAFKQMKQLIAELPMLTAPMEKEELIVYLVAAKEMLSAVLMMKREAKQMPVYFVGRALKGPEINYTSIEKIVMALVHTNFIVEQPEKESLDTLMEAEEELPEPWILFTDGSSCTDGSGARLTLINPEGMEFIYALRFRFDATNNEAKYEALISGLRIAEQMGVKNLQANVDSRLVANQVNETYVAKEADMIRYLEKLRLNLSKQVLVEDLKEKSISEAEILAKVEEEGDTWMTPIFEYLTEETLPVDKKKARTVRRKSQRFAIINRTLYKKSFLGPWLRCMGPLQTNYVLREIHEGSCSMHAGTRSVIAKALRIGYYWPTMHKDARALIRACQECQVHKPVPRNQQQKLTPITSPWSFYKWGIDIAGPFSEGPGKCEKLCIRQHFASVKHLQTNGLVERANHSLGEGIKARLGAKNKNWLEELYHVLWAQRTMIKSSNGETPFSLIYETEAVIPAEIGMPTLRPAEMDIALNNETLEVNLDLLEERREQAAIREAKSKAKMEKYYNFKVRSTSFKPGDLVYRNNDASRAEDTKKLGPKWEGPYEVTKALGKGAYKLRDRDEKQLSRTWNVSNLKRCYIHKM
ncbi:reverse transcriptase domain-containing protein [Tanacetum coccineum]